jgi:hypothetical protein
MLETSEAPASLAIVNARVWTNGRINQGDPADLVLIDDLVSLVPRPELDEQSIVLVANTNK